ncbi:hypothetical protein LCGC14_1391330 [marine sediment metagenome]|uniref:Uncharacterized protein n=1 Tax=marine sediment metagenome TaxID=412755 RepID=A0A0F9HG56_9ZZZZ
MQVVWDEIQYQNKLKIDYDIQAKDLPGFLTLGRRYMARAEAAWADKNDPTDALHELRKLAAIFVRAMVYCGVESRVKKGGKR